MTFEKYPQSFPIQQSDNAGMLEDTPSKAMSRVGATTLGAINQGAEADPCNEDYEQNVLPQQVNTHVLDQYWAEKG